MKRRASFTWLLIPLTIYVALMAVLFFERLGVTYEVNGSSQRFLEATDIPVQSEYSGDVVESLVLYDSAYPEERVIDQTIVETLDSMRVGYDLLDVNQPNPFSFKKYKTIVIAFHDLNHLKQLHELVDWVETGGRVLFATHPDMTDRFPSMYRKIGVRSIRSDNVEVIGMVFMSDLFPGSRGIRLEGTSTFLNSNSLPVQLDQNSRVHIMSADEHNMPLLWETDYGKGRFVVVNSDQFINRVNRGILGAAYSLLEDVFVYPVINSSVYFVDDFPAPIPEGENAAVTQEFGRNIRSFLINVWWPDMQKLAEKYGLTYTGLLVETYNDKVTPPFDQDVSADDHRYLGRMLLKTGGEIGLHGYNHVPLCLKQEGNNELHDYPYWPSVENAQMAIGGLDDFGQSLFPGVHFGLYVPPSNVLCPEARAWLPEVLPDLKVISSLLLEDEGEGTYIQNFEEADDGIIEFPRVVSGYYLYEYGQLALINEIGLHYVNSHFIHPDDILDPERSENRTWAQMKAQFEQQVKWVTENMPGLRQMTVEEGAMAVQRFDRLKVNAGLGPDGYEIHLGNFYDEAWLMMRTSQEPVGITGGSITKVTSNLYLIQADQPDLQVQLRK